MALPDPGEKLVVGREVGGGCIQAVVPTPRSSGLKVIRSSS